MKDTLQSILDRLKELNIFKYIAIYNNQIDRIRASQINFNSPSCYIEVKHSNTLNLGNKLNANDLNIRIHIAHLEYDAVTGRLDENINIFSIRDSIKKQLIKWNPINCGPLSTTPEMQEYKHGNIYHYIIKFNGHWVDSSAFSEKILERFYIIWSQNEITWDKANFTWDKAVGPIFNLETNVQ